MGYVGMKLVDKKMTKSLMHIFSLDETLDQLAKVSNVHWCENVLRKDKNNILRTALPFSIEITRNGGRPRRIWIQTVMEESRKSGLQEIDTATDQD